MPAFFFSCCQGGEAFYLAFAQILILLIVLGTAPLRCRFYCCWSCYYTTGRAYAGQIFPVGVDVMLPFYCCWCCYYTTAKANAAKIFAVGVGVTSPFLLLLVLLLHYGEGKCCKKNFAVGVGVALPFLLLLVLLLHYGEGKCCKKKFRRWCRRCVAVFTAVGAAITLRRRQMLPKFSPLV